MDTHQRAKHLQRFERAYGARFVPLGANKRPLVAGWTKGVDFSAAEIVEQFPDCHNVGWVLGDDHLIIDVDIKNPDLPGRQSFQRIKHLIPADCPAVETPSGGRHFYMRKPADLQTRVTLENLPGIDFKRKGGQVAIPAGNGSGYNWTCSPWNPPPSAPPELLDLIRDLPEPPKPPSNPDPDTPGNDYSANGDIRELLERHGWRYLGTAADGNQRFRRPGKRDGISGTLRDGVFYCWSSSVPPLEAEKAYSGFQLFTALEHGGDFSAAAKALANLGYGKPAQISHGSPRTPQTPPEATGDDGRRVVPVEAGSQHTAFNAILGELPRFDGFYNANCVISTVVDGKIHNFGVPELKIELCRRILFARPTVKGDLKPINPPHDLVASIAETHSYPGLRELTLVYPFPVLTREGVAASGYHQDSRLFIHTDCKIEGWNQNPTMEEVRNRCFKILELVEEFPFKTAADKAAWFASFLTLFLKPSAGPTPLFLFNGNKAGVGKSKLVELISAIAMGVPMPAQMWPSDNDEMKKNLMGTALAGEFFYSLDNVPNDGEFGCPALDMAITSQRISDRVLGKNKKVTAEIRCVFYATGNRIKISAESDSLRRVLPITLLTHLENPESKQDFKYPDLIKHAIDNRSSLLGDVVTILSGIHAHRGHIVANGGYEGMPTWGSFNAGWEIVRHLCVAIGLEDPYRSREGLVEEDQTKEAMRNLIQWLQFQNKQDGGASSGAELFKRLQQDGNARSPDADQVWEFLGMGQKRQPTSIHFSLALTRRCNQTVGDLWIVKERSRATNSTLFKVEEA